MYIDKKCLIVFFYIITISFSFAQSKTKDNELWAECNIILDCMGNKENTLDCLSLTYGISADSICSSVYKDGEYYLKGVHRGYFEVFVESDTLKKIKRISIRGDGAIISNLFFQKLRSKSLSFKEEKRRTIKEGYTNRYTLRGNRKKNIICSIITASSIVSKTNRIVRFYIYEDY